MSPGNGARYFLKKGDGTIYGPADIEALKAWAREGRVAPDDLVSKDKEFWYPAPTLTDLEMNWLVQLTDGTQYGPIHLHALQELVEDGSLSPNDVVTNRITEEICTLGEAIAASATAAQAAPAAEVGAQEPDAFVPNESIAAPAETTPSAPGALVSAPEAAAPEKTAPAEAEPPPASWRELAARKDFLERELTKWKQMYEQEHAHLVQSMREHEERIQALKKSELAALTRAEQLERKLKESEENYRVLCESLASDPTRPYAQQLVALTELHRDLAQRYDAVTRLLQEKNSEIADLLEARSRSETRAEEQLRQMQEIVERERHEADQARRRALEIETDYVQLIQAYRDLNEKFMQLRQSLAGASAPTAPAAPRKRR